MYIVRPLQYDGETFGEPLFYTTSKIPNIFDTADNQTKGVRVVGGGGERQQREAVNWLRSGSVEKQTKLSLR